jgi:RHS repeat-associated protein
VTAPPPGPGDLPPLAIKLPDTDKSTGALEYSYPIIIPPGRNGMQPDLSLQYNSQTTQSTDPFGYGWTISIPYIKRINKDGSDNLYSENYYYSSTDGELDNISGSSYGAKVENGSFNKYDFSGNTWTVTDKSGTAYTYGSSASTRQDDSTNTEIYKWMLEKVQDTNGNYVSYSYYKDSGNVYPSSITYTSNGALAGIYEVDFLRTSRTDTTKVYDTGFPVTANYLINEIDVKVGGTWMRKYALTYTTGDNGHRSLLSTITESGKDDTGTITTLPPETLTYQCACVSWSNASTSWSVPVDTLYEGGVLVGDVNGDGFTDIVQSYEDSSNPSTNKHRTYLNTGNGGWTLSSSFVPPAAFIISGTTLPDQGARLADVNGDSLPDIVIANDNTDGVYLNNGSGWTAASYYPPISLSGTHGPFAQMVDINGDNLPDFIQQYGIFGGGTVTNIYLNNGAGWTSSSTWAMPTDVGFMNGTELADVNGDGLVDMVTSYKDSGGTWTKKVYLNNGINGWNLDTSWLPSRPFIDGTVAANNADQGDRFLDTNYDGLADIVESNSSSANCDRDNGMTGWTYTSSYCGITIPFVNFGSYPSDQDTRVQFGDIDGNGITDIFKGKTNSLGTGIDPYVNVMTGVQADVLTSISYPQGGSTTISYKQSTLNKSGTMLLNPNLPYNVDTVYQVTTNDGFGTTGTTTYSYAGGEYYFNSNVDRKIAGFHIVTATDPAGNVTKTYYHQGDTTDAANGEYSDSEAKIGKPYRVEEYDGSGNLYRLTVSKWDSTNLGTGRDFVYQVRKTELDYDGNSTHRDTATTYTYDTSDGNLTDKREYGEVMANTDGNFVDTGSDMRNTAISYASNLSAYIVGLPSDETVTDQTTAKVAETKHYYDTLALGSVNTGNETKTEKWVAGTTYVNTQKSYNSFGLLTSSTDERGKTTSYSYDSYNLYPITVTNPLSQNTSYTYDYTSGKVKTATDPNLYVFTTVYDGFDRPTQVLQPDQTVPTSSVVKTTYAYTDTSGANNVKTSQYLDSSNIVDTYAYLDGFGRKIQDRTETETSGTYDAKDYIYNSRGFLDKESLPYASSGTSRTSPTTTTALLISYSYDPVQRITNTVNALGTTSNSYDQWATTTTDANSKVKKYYKNAYSNLVRVDENNSGSTYSTYYAYDLLGDLTGITDGLGNVRSFVYDGLGRRMVAQDLHDPADAVFGVWNYAYDNVGNLTQSVNSNGQTVNYGYDDINRVLNEDYTGAPGIEIMYSYDTCTVSKLCTVNMAAVNSSYIYSPTGQVATESRVIGGTAYTTSYTYDRQGNKLTITYPDSSMVQYAYNNGGLLETVSQKESGGAYSPVITNIDYSPMNQPTFLAYQNGLTTTNTYDASHMYELSNKVTAGAGPHLQDLAYSYDNAGNITQIADTGTSGTAKIMTYTYDDLYRLTQASATGALAPGNYTENYSYNAIGDLTLKTGQGAYAYAGNVGTNYANPHAATTIGAKAYTYDNTGNILTETGGNMNTWNYKSQLVQTVVPGTPPVTVTYSYDQDGNRVTYTSGATTTTYPNSLYYKTGTTNTKQIYAGDELVASIENSTGTAVRHYVNTDHLTGSNIITNAAGATDQVLDYFPFGTQRINMKFGAFDEDTKFAGHEHDVTANVEYMGARYDQADQGRFTSEDPVFLAIGDIYQIRKESIKNMLNYLSNPQSLNSYSYTGNNPITKIDPNGKSYWEIGVSSNIEPLSTNVGLKVDFKNLRLDYTSGIGFAAGDSVDISAMYHSDNLPEAHVYVTTGAGVTAGYGLIGKFSVDNTRSKNNNTVKNEPSAATSYGLGTGVGVSGDITENSSYTLIDYSKQINKISSIAQAVKSAVVSVANNVKSIISNKENKNGAR